MASQQRSPYLVPGLVAVAIGVVVLTQIRGTIDDAGQATQDVIQQAGQTADDLIGTAGSVVTGGATSPPGGGGGGAGTGSGTGPGAGGSRPSASPPLIGPEDIIQAVGRIGTRTITLGDHVADEMVGLSIDERRQIGAAYHRGILNDPDTVVSGDTAMVQWLQQLAAPFVDHLVEASDLDITVTLLEDDMINAFAHVGGYVYVCRGLLEAMDYDKHAIRFVIGHEIAHVELGQCARRVYARHRMSQAGGSIVGAIGGKAHQLVQVNYSQHDEMACDVWSYRAMRAMGHSKQEGKSATKRMLALEQQHGHTGQHHAPQGVAEAIAKVIGDHFCTHPSAAERLAALDAID